METNSDYQQQNFVIFKVTVTVKVDKVVKAIKTAVYFFFFRSVQSTDIFARETVRKKWVQLKNCSPRTLFGQKLGQHGPHPKSSSIIFLEIKEDHKLSINFYFIKV